MKLKNAIPSLAAAVLAAVPIANAQNATTDPVGFVTITPLPNSDTIVSTPLNRESVFSGSVSAISGNVVSVSGAPGWASNQFVLSSPTQNNTYFLSFSSGAKAGMFYTIQSNTDNSVTLDLAGDSLSGVSEGASVTISPYWTFGTLFPSGAGVSGTSSHGSRPTEILLYNVTTAGINLSPTDTYYYFTGAGNGGPGWRKVGGGLSTIRNNDVLPPDSYMVYRQNDSTQNSFSVVGGVLMKPFATILSTLAGNTPQDNFVAFPVAADMTLSQTNLFESGAFVGSSSHGTRQDELLVFDNSVSGINKSPSQTYYYFTGAGNGGPGWRLVGGGISNIRNNDVVYKSGQGVIIRKAAQPSAVSVVESFNPPYANQ